MNKLIVLAAMLSLHLLPSHAQFRINNGSDSPLRKLQIAELAISNLYVDSVDEQKLAEASKAMQSEQEQAEKDLKE